MCYERTCTWFGKEHLVELALENRTVDHLAVAALGDLGRPIDHDEPVVQARRADRLVNVGGERFKLIGVVDDADPDLMPSDRSLDARNKTTFFATYGKGFISKFIGGQSRREGSGIGRP